MGYVEGFSPNRCPVDADDLMGTGIGFQRELLLNSTQFCDSPPEPLSSTTSSVIGHETLYLHVDLNDERNGVLAMTIARGPGLD